MRLQGCTEFPFTAIFEFLERYRLQGSEQPLLYQTSVFNTFECSYWTYTNSCMVKLINRVSDVKPNAEAKIAVSIKLCLK